MNRGTEEHRNRGTPTQHTAGWDNTFGFGSAPSNGLYFALCNGSVRFVNYSIVERIYRCLANHCRRRLLSPILGVFGGQSATGVASYKACVAKGTNIIAKKTSQIAARRR
jgi:hypothetical protein